VGIDLAPQVGFEPTTLRLTANLGMRRVKPNEGRQKGREMEAPTDWFSIYLECFKVTEGQRGTLAFTSVKVQTMQSVPTAPETRYSVFLQIAICNKPVSY
jgi:hypothetical protein